MPPRVFGEVGVNFEVELITHGGFPSSAATTRRQRDHDEIPSFVMECWDFWIPSICHG